MNIKNRIATIQIIQTGSSIRFLSCVAFVFFALYIYFVGAATFAAANWKETEQKIGETKTHLSTIESEYFKIVSGIDLTRAYTLGYRNTSEDTAYVSRSHAHVARLTVGNAGL